MGDIVAAVSRFGERLRSPRSGLLFDVMRDNMAKNLNRAGLLFQATRREDRPHLRQEIAAGKTPLRQNKSAPICQHGSGEPAFRTPLWWGRFGREAMAREKKYSRYLTRPPKPEDMSVFESPPRSRSFGFRRQASAQNGSIPKPYQALFRELKSAFHDPHDALQRFELMAMEGGREETGGAISYPNRGFAIWSLLNRPYLFGEIRSAVSSPAWRERAGRILKDQNLPHPNFYPYEAMIGNDASLPAERHAERAKRDRAAMAWSLEALVRYLEQHELGKKESTRIRNEILRILETKITTEAHIEVRAIDKNDPHKGHSSNSAISFSLDR